jgi:radical SAM enzyme (TIGR01210 family)
VNKQPTNWPVFADAEILAARPPRNVVDVNTPYAFFVEPEFQSQSQTVENVATVFLTNQECPFRCLMCDLWKNTTTEPVPVGSIPNQIEHALRQLPKANHIKLYNAANFFDPQSIPEADYEAIFEEVRPFKSVIVENHPNLCGTRCLSFGKRIQSNGQRFEVAMGLECVHPEVLLRLNKQMTLDDFRRATEKLIANGIQVRAFILLRPPFLTEQEGVEWAIKSIEFAFDAGVDCCSVIPTRFGNGMLKELHSAGWFSPPSLQSMENVLAAALCLNRGRVFMDTWDADQFTNCQACANERIDRINQMNSYQLSTERVCCGSCD